jgi:hypothetical protein
MATVDEMISDALEGIELARPALPILAALVPEAGVIVGPALTILYEGLVAVRAARAHQNPEEQVAAVRQKITEAIQDLAVLKFGAQP